MRGPGNAGSLFRDRDRDDAAPVTVIDRGGKTLGGTRADKSAQRVLHLVSALRSFRKVSAAGALEGKHGSASV